MVSAQMSCYCFFFAKRTLSRIFNFICHRHFLFVNSICLTHGVRK
jgi:hypothetical protein